MPEENKKQPSPEEQASQSEGDEPISETSPAATPSPKAPTFAKATADKTAGEADSNKPATDEPEDIFSPSSGPSVSPQPLKEQESPAIPPQQKPQKDEPFTTPAASPSSEPSSETYPAPKTEEETTLLPETPLPETPSPTPPSPETPVPETLSSAAPSPETPSPTVEKPLATPSPKASADAKALADKTAGEAEKESPLGQPPAPEQARYGADPASEPSVPPTEGAGFETPELNKQEIIKEAHDEGVTPEEEEKIQVMPEKFKKMKATQTGKKAGKKTLILAGIIIFLVILGGVGFYLWTQGYFLAQSKDSPPVAEVEEVIEEPIEVPVEEAEEEPEEPVLSEEQTLKVDLLDETEEITITSAQFYLPEGALEKDAQIELSGSLVTEEIKEQESFTQSSYEIIGALYTFTPADVVLNRAGALSIFYDESLVNEKWEEDIVLGYFKDDVWSSLPGTIDTENNTVTIELEIFPSDTLALMVHKDKLAPKVEEFQIAKNIPSSADSDNDGLTDIEENVFSLETNNPDTDGDGNPDGQEIIGLMHPLSADQDKIAMSGLVNVYTNPTYSYSFFYPNKWLTRALPDTDNQEVLIITNTGEFFSVTVDSNTSRLSAIDWYVKQSPQVDKSLLYETTVFNQAAVWNPSRLTIYIAKDDRVYILSYSVGIEKEANFKTTFEMIINSFQFVVQVQGRADGTLIKYPDKPEVYMIEGGKKRGFQSGEIFETLGFLWEDVIEIPLSETYADGDSITGRLDGTLIKYPDDPGIYFIDNKEKRAFKSGELFEALGFKWEDVIEIPIEETYPDGPIIESKITTSTPSVE